jgi:hypothetical protein
MANHAALRCDGCGQAASPEHIARRLQRLEWATRYRPIHIGALLLGDVAPSNDADFLYAPAGAFSGEAALVLRGRGVETAGKSRETVLAEFQRGGFFLTHVLECPLEPGKAEKAGMEGLVAERLASVIARIRRSLQPKKVIAISPMPGFLLEQLKKSCTDVAVLES